MAGTDERIVGADRVLAVLVELAGRPDGVTLDEMTTIVGASKPTVHRALASLRRARLATQMSGGLYRLGDEFFRIAYRNRTMRPEMRRIDPLLRRLARTYGETAHFAVLDGTDVVYRSKVDPPVGAMRLTSTIGGRNPAYRTAVGKLLLGHAVESADDLRSRLGANHLPSTTPNTITSIAALWREARRARDDGFAIDDQENEPGINCVAVAVTEPGGTRPIGAISISALSFRTPLPRLIELVPRLRELARDAMTPVGTSSPSDSD